VASRRINQQRDDSLADRPPPDRWFRKRSRCLAGREHRILAESYDLLAGAERFESVTDQSVWTIKVPRLYTDTRSEKYGFVRNLH